MSGNIDHEAIVSEHALFLEQFRSRHFSLPEITDRSHPAVLEAIVNTPRLGGLAASEKLSVRGWIDGPDSYYIHIIDPMADRACYAMNVAEKAVAVSGSHL